MCEDDRIVGLVQTILGTRTDLPELPLPARTRLLLDWFEVLRSDCEALAVLGIEWEDGGSGSESGRYRCRNCRASATTDGDRVHIAHVAGCTVGTHYTDGPRRTPVVGAPHGGIRDPHAGLSVRAVADLSPLAIERDGGHRKLTLYDVAWWHEDDVREELSRLDNALIDARRELEEARNGS